MAIVKSISCLPTTLAISMAIKVDLFVPPEEENDNVELYMDLRDKLIEFQKAALTTSFDRSIVVYWEHNLTTPQLERLKVIHENTRDWIRGHVVGTLMNKLETAKDKHADIAGLLFEEIGPAEPEQGKGGMPKGQRKGMLVHLANLDTSTAESYVEDEEE